MSWRVLFAHHATEDYSFLLGMLRDIVQLDETIPVENQINGFRAAGRI
jgi:hypothetical protein